MTSGSEPVGDAPDRGGAAAAGPRAPGAPSRRGWRSTAGGLRSRLAAARRRGDGEEAGRGPGADGRAGEGWPRAAIDYAAGTGEEVPDPGPTLRWEGSRDMDGVIGTATDADRADWLSTTIPGRGGLRRPKDVLARGPDGLQRWRAGPDGHRRGRGRPT